MRKGDVAFGRGRSIVWGAALGVLWLAEASLAQAESEPLESGVWIENMLVALRPGDSLAAHATAWTRDETGSERRFEIEFLRQSRGRRHTTVVEMRADESPAPAVVKIEFSPRSGLATWSWDVRIQRFVRMRGLEGTEPFAGTHFRIEDLGLTGLQERRGGDARRATFEGMEVVELTSPPYFYYGRVVTRIDPVTHLPTVIDVFDRTDALIRQLRYSSVERFSGHPFPTRMTFRDRVTDAETRLDFDWVRIGVKARGRDFDLQELARRLQGGDDPLRLAR